MVKPILLYGSEIWGFSKNIQCLEKVQLRFCKLLLKLKTSTPSYMIYGELGLFPIEIDVKLRMISYWARLLTETKLSWHSIDKLCVLPLFKTSNIAFVAFSACFLIFLHLVSTILSKFRPAFSFN
jgi:hypothetical protein